MRIPALPLIHYQSRKPLLGKVTRSEGSSLLAASLLFLVWPPERRGLRGDELPCVVLLYESRKKANPRVDGLAFAGFSELREET